MKDINYIRTLSAAEQKSLRIWYIFSITGFIFLISGMIFLHLLQWYEWRIITKKVVCCNMRQSGQLFTEKLQQYKKQYEEMVACIKNSDDFDKKFILWRERLHHIFVCSPFLDSLEIGPKKIRCIASCTSLDQVNELTRTLKNNEHIDRVQLTSLQPISSQKLGYICHLLCIIR